MADVRIDSDGWVRPSGDRVVKVAALGGDRRSRGARLAAWVRENPGAVVEWRNYSETYGFQSATYGQYRIPYRVDLIKH